MKPSEQYRAMAAWFRTHEFSPDIGHRGGKCGCFISAESADGRMPMSNVDIVVLESVIGARSLADRHLSAAGWTGPEATRDAEAACSIAADICEEEGR